MWLPMKLASTRKKLLVEICIKNSNYLQLYCTPTHHTQSFTYKMEKQLFCYGLLMDIVSIL